MARIPPIQERLELSHATLGTLLVMLGVGALVGMQVAGRLADRVGAHRLLPISAALASAMLVLPGLAFNAWSLGAALAVFGFFHGTMDVVMNAYAVHVEKAYGRAIMSSFHAMFSIGGAAAAAVAIVTIGVTPVVAMAVIAAVSVVLSFLGRRWLRSFAVAEPQVHAGQDPAGQARKSGGVWALAVLALFGFLCEGAANDWSALHLVDVVLASPELGALAFGAFSTTMTLGRLTADRVSRALGPAAVVGGGAAIAFVGSVIIVTAAVPWLAIAGWSLLGVGLSGIVPQLFSAAGRIDPAAGGTNVAKVASLGYFGLLAGPAVIGWLAHVVPLNWALSLLALLTLAILCSARLVNPIRRSEAKKAPMASDSTEAV